MFRSSSSLFAAAYSSASSKEVIDFICSVSSSPKTQSSASSSSSSLLQIGDSVYGEDQIENKLQERVAKELFNKKAGILFPTLRSGLLASISAHDRLHKTKFIRSVPHHHHESKKDEEKFSSAVSLMTGKAVTTSLNVASRGDEEGDCVVFAENEIVSFPSSSKDNNSDNHCRRLHLTVTDQSLLSNKNESQMKAKFDGIYSILYQLPSSRSRSQQDSNKNKTGPAVLVSNDEDFINFDAARIRKQLGMGTRQIGMMAAASYYELFGQ